MNNEKQISNEMADRLLDVNPFDMSSTERCMIKDAWNKHNLIEESALEKARSNFKSYKCMTSRDGFVLANDMAIIRTLGAEMIIAFEKKLAKLNARIKELEDSQSEK